MIGNENGLFGMVARCYIRLKAQVILLPVNYGYYSTAKEAGFDALWVYDAGMRARRVQYYVMLLSD